MTENPTVGVVRELLERAIGDDETAKYLAADYGSFIGVYLDGSFSVGDDVGMEIEPDERPVARAKCPGLGNFDEASAREYLMDGLKGRHARARVRHLPLRELIDEYVYAEGPNGTRQSLIEALVEDFEDC